MQEIVIITVVRRPGNIPYIYHSICDYPLNVKVHLALIFLKDNEKEFELWSTKLKRAHAANFFPTCYLFKNSCDAGCYAVRNWMLEMMDENNEMHEFDDHWVYFLEDNNIIHKEMLDSVAKASRLLGGKNIMLFNQITREGRMEKFGSLASLTTGQVGLNMAIFRQGLIHSIRFEEYAEDPAQAFVQKMYHANAPGKIWCNSRVVYDNYLE